MEKYVRLVKDDVGEGGRIYVGRREGEREGEREEGKGRRGRMVRESKVFIV